MQIEITVGNIDKQSTSKRDGKGKSLTSFCNNFVVLDLETTGLSPEWDEIIEIAAIKIQNGAVIDEYQQLIKPSFPVNEFITELTGITNEMLADKPSINLVIDDFLTFVSDSIVVGHNVNFDINFIYDSSMTIKGYPFKNDFIDTMRFARKLLPELNHHRLKDLIDHFDIDITRQHRALNDCYTTLEVYNNLLSLAKDNYSSLEEFSKSFLPKRYDLDLRTIKSQNDNFDESNPLFEKNCVFTSTLEKMTRAEAAQLVVDLGGIAQNGITKNTNYLILGNNDYCKSIKNGKSNKQKKAEEYILKGYDLTIIPENVFYDMVELDSNNSISNNDM